MSAELQPFIQKLNVHTFNKEKGQSDLQLYLEWRYNLLLNNQLSSLTILNRKLNNDAVILLSDMIKNNTYLQSLVLNGITVNEKHLKILLKAIAKNKSIHTLQLKYIILDDDDNDKDAYTRSIGKILKRNTTITHLILQDSFKLKGIYKIVKGLIKNTSVISLTMFSMDLNDDAAYLISRMLRVNKTITQLNIGNNYITGIGLQYISNSLQNKSSVKHELLKYNDDKVKRGLNSTLTSLNISNNNENFVSTETISTFFTKENLTKLNIYHNSVNFDIMANYLHNNGPSNITKLNLTYTTHVYSGDYMENMSKIFKHLPYINNIDLSQNMLNISDIKLLSEVMPLTIEKLNISNSLLDDSASDYIGHILQNFNIVKFNMENGNIEDDEALHEVGKTIAQVLSNNNKLKWLNISTNDINKENMDAITDALRFNTTLEHLDVSANSLNRNNINNIIDMLYINKTLRSIDLSYNKIHVQEMISIGKLLLVNDSLHTLDIITHTEPQGLITVTSPHDVAMLYIFTALRKNTTLKSLHINQVLYNILKYVNSVFTDVSYDSVINSTFEYNDEVKNFMNSVKGINTTLEIFNKDAIETYLVPYLERNIKNRVLKNSRLETIMYNRISDDDKQFLPYYIHDKNKNK